MPIGVPRRRALLIDAADVIAAPAAPKVVRLLSGRASPREYGRLPAVRSPLSGSTSNSFFRVLLGAALFALLSGCAPKFDASRFLGHIAYLASDDLGGRGVGTPGIELAADYIAAQFKAAGLKPAGADGTWFQPFEMAVGNELGTPRLAVRGLEPAEAAREDFVPFSFSGHDRFEGPLAFAGYGITHDDANYDDYTGFDAEGKVLLMLRYEPHADDPEAKFGGKSPSAHASFRSKARLAAKHKAKAILIVNPPLHHGEPDELMPFDSDGHGRRVELPMLHITRAFAEKLLKAGGLDDLTTLQKTLDGQRKPLSKDLAGLNVEGDPGISQRRVMTRNVIGECGGAGSLAHEYVVIGAHYDHLGKTVPRLPAASGSGDEAQIHNGADDNASGTAGVIELARAFGTRGSGGRSVLFMAFSGEETGLIGSDYYVDHPTVSLDKIVAMLNLDMVGRMRNNRVEVFGTDTATQFNSLIRDRGERLGFELKVSGSGFGPSDHTSFYKKQVPALHFFTGLHNDYHMPSDDTATVNAEGGARLVAYVYAVAGAIAAAPDRPTYVATTDTRTPRTGLKVRMGVMPSYAQDDQAGMLVEGASPGSPAEKAGIREGDRLITLGEHEINDVYDLMEALGHYQPGDTASVTILRKGQKLNMGVTFEAPRR